MAEKSKAIGTSDMPLPQTIAYDNRYQVTDLFKKEEPFYQELNQLHLILQNSANVIDKADLILAYSRYFENAFYQKHSRL